MARPQTSPLPPPRPAKSTSGFTATEAPDSGPIMPMPRD